MERFQILLTPEQLADLRETGETTGIPVAKLVRDAVDLFLTMKNARKAAILLDMSIERFIHTAVREKIERDLPGVPIFEPPT